jgi:hypothetical protein
MNGKTPIPERMRHLKIDRRGYAIPVSIVIDDSGMPNFTINDELARHKALRHDSCGLCGKPLFRGRWFIGGPAPAFHPHGAYLDLPMHDECAHYALQTCPFIAAPHYGREVGPQQQKKLEAQGSFVVRTDDNVTVERPLMFVAVMATGQHIINDGQYVKPRTPYRKVEYWRHSKQLDEAEGIAQAMAITGFTETEIRKTYSDVKGRK